jgi:hypothetical protein
MSPASMFIWRVRLCLVLVLVGFLFVGTGGKNGSLPSQMAKAPPKPEAVKVQKASTNSKPKPVARGFSATLLEPAVSTKAKVKPADS